MFGEDVGDDLESRMAAFKHVQDKMTEVEMHCDALQEDIHAETEVLHDLFGLDPGGDLTDHLNMLRELKEKMDREQEQIQKLEHEIHAETNFIFEVFGVEIGEDEVIKITKNTLSVKKTEKIENNVPHQKKNLKIQDESTHLLFVYNSRLSCPNLFP